MPIDNEYFSDIINKYEYQREWFELELSALGFEVFTGIGSDNYDCSVEFYGVGNDERLSNEAQKFLYDEGFLRAFVNHQNGVQTVYSFLENPTKGWRVDRTRMLMSYLPEGWKSHMGYAVQEDL